MSREDATRRFVERLALTLSATGFPRMAARVFVAILVDQEGRRTAAELVDDLGVSPAAVSGGVRYLEAMGLVAREREPGERRDHYRVYEDVWFEIFARQDRLFADWESDLRDGVYAVGLDTPAGARLEETRKFFDFIRGQFPELMNKWRALRAEGGPELERAGEHRAAD